MQVLDGQGTQKHLKLSHLQEPFMFTPGTREYELAGRSSCDIVHVDYGIFQRVASNKLAARAR